MTSQKELPENPTKSVDDELPGKYLAETPILDYDHMALQGLIGAREWMDLDPIERASAIYDFVRNDIAFGYNADDNISASRVLADGYGQCNTKATLLMALLRGAQIPCRFHAAAVRQDLQHGVIPRPFLPLAPREILHAWVEVPINGSWIQLEGVILDEAYLSGVCSLLDRRSGPVLGYGVGTEDVADPPVAWTGVDTRIQMMGVSRDYGVFDDPDSWYSSAGTNLSGVKSLVYRTVVRRLMNRRVRRIRQLST